MNPIRTARLTDAPALAALFDQLGYPDTAAFLPDNIAFMLASHSETFLVFEENNQILGCITASFSIFPQLHQPVCTITSLIVHNEYRGRDIGAQLETTLSSIAHSRGCGTIVVHCHERRTAAHNFYHNLGYEESPKYLIKAL